MSITALTPFLSSRHLFALDFMSTIFSLFDFMTINFCVSHVQNSLDYVQERAELHDQWKRLLHAVSAFDVIYIRALNCNDANVYLFFRFCFAIILKRCRQRDSRFRTWCIILLKQFQEWRIIKLTWPASCLLPRTAQNVCPNRRCFWHYVIGS